MDGFFSPETIKELCQKYDLLPSKQYGQHYLISEKPIEKMIAAAELAKNDTVVEIGPGFGVLTLSVAPLVKKVIAFEIEQKLRLYWEETLETRNKKLETGENTNIEIIWGNALSKFSMFNDQFPTYKVLANLPYQITSEALRTIFETENKPSIVIVMVQKEVAERICAKAGDMSLLGLSVQYYGTPRIVCQVSKGAFWPQPKVDSAVVAISLKHENIKTLKHDEDIFFRVARAGFSHKRKQLWGNIADGLKLDGGMVKKAIFEVCGNEKVRGEELGIEEWKRLIEKLDLSTP